MIRIPDDPEPVETTMILGRNGESWHEPEASR